jgi:hypothetical protein
MNKKYVDKTAGTRYQYTFTIVTKSRVLELEAPSIDSKNLWMGFFEKLLLDKQSGGPGSTPH